LRSETQRHANDAAHSIYDELDFSERTASVAHHAAETGRE